METEDIPLEVKCENLMNEVVHYRKQIGKACVNYDKKTLDLEIKLLTLQSKTSLKYKPKPKITVPSCDTISSQQMDDFLLELASRQQHIQNLKNKLKNTNDIITQLMSDGVSKRLKEPITADAIMAAKIKEP